MLGKLRRNQDGAAAVEFALVALPFIGLLVAVVELGVFFFATRYFEDGVFNASRKVMTQSLGSGNACTAFKNEIAASFPSWINPNNIVLTVKENAGFGGTPTAVDLSAGGCTFGAAGKVVTITATYPYPFKGFRIAVGGTLWGAGTNLSLSTAFRVEP
ncbi:MAG: TadE/TadG family type IV pilus assembly protein [Beijerinckiaceae bacterium]